MRVEVRRPAPAAAGAKASVPVLPQRRQGRDRARERPAGAPPRGGSQARAGRMLPAAAPALPAGVTTRTGPGSGTAPFCGSCGQARPGKVPHRQRGQRAAPAAAGPPGRDAARRRSLSRPGRAPACAVRQARGASAAGQWAAGRRAAGRGRRAAGGGRRACGVADAGRRRRAAACGYRLAAADGAQSRLRRVRAMRTGGAVTDSPRRPRGSPGVRRRAASGGARRRAGASRQVARHGGTPARGRRGSGHASARTGPPYRRSPAARQRS